MKSKREMKKRKMRLKGISFDMALTFFIIRMKKENFPNWEAIIKDYTNQGGREKTIQDREDLFSFVFTIGTFSKKSRISMKVVKEIGYIVAAIENQGRIKEVYEGMMEITTDGLGNKRANDIMRKGLSRLNDRYELYRLKDFEKKTNKAKSSKCYGFFELNTGSGQSENKSRMLDYVEKNTKCVPEDGNDRQYLTKITKQIQKANNIIDYEREYKFSSDVEKTLVKKLYALHNMTEGNLAFRIACFSC